MALPPLSPRIALPVPAVRVQAKASALNISAPERPAMPGRYLLPDDGADFDALSDALAGAGALAGAWAGYGIIQALTMALLIGRCG